MEAGAGGPAHSGSLSPRTQKQRPCRGPGKETLSPQTPGSWLSEAALPLADRGAGNGREEQRRLSRPGAAKAKDHPLAATRCVHRVRGPRPGEEPGRRYRSQPSPFRSRPRAQLGCLGNERIILFLPACCVSHLLGLQAAQSLPLGLGSALSVSGQMELGGCGMGARWWPGLC